ncbi:MAG: hypothetical protein EXX96DRAFT_531071 [Benjaminiella poitrasii]|nr:MAG: hypothetical protein EXX96DRAFT_531071 [Benjaminiella poitrasii]
MNNEFQINVQEYWKNTWKVAETALAMLSVFEGKNIELIDNVISPLRDLVNQGQDYGDTFKPIQKPPTLDAAITDIYKAPYIAIDCEFMGSKKNSPELKLLQIGVSPLKGYAIQIDVLGFEVLSAKLKPVLEDDNLNIVGWSYRSDGIAIESYFKDIVPASVLDLQAKMLPIAVEQLNLAAAMTNYAQHWEGLEEFQKAKQFSENFKFTDSNCVWLLNPLPPRALVYAVFDVLSVHALYDYTKQYPTTQKHYYPYSVTTDASPKAIENFHRQRAKAIQRSNTNSPSTVSVNKERARHFAPTVSPALASSMTNTPSTSSPSTFNPPGSSHATPSPAPINTSASSSRKKEKDRYNNTIQVPLSPQPETDDGYDDNNAAYKHDLQKAIVESLRTQESKKGESSNDRVVCEMDYETEFKTFAQDTTKSKPAEKKAENKPEVTGSTWGEIKMDNQPFLGNNFQWNDKESVNREPPKSPVTTEPKVTPLSPHHPPRQPNGSPYNGSFKSPQYRHQQHAYSANRPGLNLSGSSAPQVSHPRPSRPNYPNYTPPTFEGKPSKEKYIAEFTSRVNVGEQTNSFSWGEPDSIAASWNTFASNSNNNWDKGIDTELDDMERLEAEAKRKTAEEMEAAAAQNKPDAAANTEEDNWSKQDDRTDTMIVPMNQIPIRKVFSGPRVNNPNLSDYDDDDDDDDDDDGDDRDKDNELQVYDLPNFVDGIFLYSENGNEEMSILKMTKPEDLDRIVLPPPGTPFTVTICFHLAADKLGNNKILKALQLYLSTGASYTCVLQQACLLKNRGTLKETKFGKLLTDPSIHRVCWYPLFIEDSMVDTLGFPIGPCVDLSIKMNAQVANDESYSFKQAVEVYLHDWPDLHQYLEAKKEYDQTVTSKKFSGTSWDREKLPEDVLKYSAFQGLAAYTLYQASLKMNISDKNYMYTSTNS